MPFSLGGVVQGTVKSLLDEDTNNINHNNIQIAREGGTLNNSECLLNTTVASKSINIISPSIDIFHLINIIDSTKGSFTPSSKILEYKHKNQMLHSLSKRSLSGVNPHEMF